jgi:hypothetical protein
VNLSEVLNQPKSVNTRRIDRLIVFKKLIFAQLVKALLVFMESECSQGLATDPCPEWPGLARLSTPSSFITHSVVLPFSDLCLSLPRVHLQSALPTNILWSLCSIFIIPPMHATWPVNHVLPNLRNINITWRLQIRKFHVTLFPLFSFYLPSVFRNTGFAFTYANTLDF